MINPLYTGLVRVSAGVNLPERIVKGIHKAIVTESQYYRLQEMLGLQKRSMRSKPKDEFPLKGILKSPCSNTNMTAGCSKGKKDYYLYYRCVKHTNVNISGKVLHEKFDELLKNLSFTQKFINKLVGRITKLSKSTMNISEQRKKILDGQLRDIEVKLLNVEEKLFGGTIVDKTYKRWVTKLEGEKGQT